MEGQFLECQLHDGFRSLRGNAVATRLRMQYPAQLTLSGTLQPLQHYLAHQAGGVVLALDGKAHPVAFLVELEVGVPAEDLHGLGLGQLVAQEVPGSFGKRLITVEPFKVLGLEPPQDESIGDDGKLNFGHDSEATRYGRIMVQS